MENNKDNKIFPIVPAAIAVVFLATVIAISTFSFSAFAMQHEGGGNETMKNMGESANQTGEAIQGNASDLGTNVTEGAKD